MTGVWPSDATPASIASAPPVQGQTNRGRCRSWHPTPHERGGALPFIANEKRIENRCVAAQHRRMASRYEVALPGAHRDVVPAPDTPTVPGGLNRLAKGLGMGRSVDRSAPCSGRLGRPCPNRGIAWVHDVVAGVNPTLWPSWCAQLAPVPSECDSTVRCWCIVNAESCCGRGGAVAILGQQEAEGVRKVE